MGKNINPREIPGYVNINLARNRSKLTVILSTSTEITEGNHGGVGHRAQRTELCPLHVIFFSSRADPTEYYTCHQCGSENILWTPASLHPAFIQGDR